MDRLSAATKAFIEFLLSKVARVSHKDVVPFLTKLLQMAKIFEGECCSEEELLLQDLLSNLLKQESKLRGKDGVNLLVSLMKVVDLLFHRLMEQVNMIRKLQAEREHLLAEIDELHTIVDAIRESDKMTLDETPLGVADFESVLSSVNYITHYVSHHRDFSSLVIVVLWKSQFPGPALCHDDKPLLYVHQASSTEEAFDTWSDLRPDNSAPPKREYTASELQDAIRIKEVIAEHQKRLFAQHSNLVAIRSSDHENGTFFIEFVVLCKRFVPVTDKGPLPRHLEGIPTRVVSGWIELCGLKEQAFHRPLLPGAGFAAGNDAELQLDVLEENYIPPVLGTLGGYYVANGVRYGVTCAHCIRMHKQANLHSPGTPVYQPVAMGLVVKAAAYVPGLLGAYDNLKYSKGRHGGMKWLINELRDDPDFTTELPAGSQCGVVHGGVLGSLDNGGAVVDVALVKLDVDVMPHCASSLTFPDLKSPSLALGETATTNILELKDFPQNIFHVYGRGARSIDTMEAIVNPFQSDIYFRLVQPSGLEGLSFYCIHAEVSKNWQPGDSGTWCWTDKNWQPGDSGTLCWPDADDGLLVGMGMAHAHIDGRHFCCIIPMSNVVAAIEQLIQPVI